MNTEEKDQPQIFPEVNPEKEEFFNKMSEYFHDCTPKIENKSISSLLNLYFHMVQTRNLFRALQLPWSTLIPIVHKGCTLSVPVSQGQINTKKHVRRTTDLISAMCYLNKNQKVIYKMSVFYSHQVQALESLLRQKGIEVPPMDMESADGD